MTTTQIQRFVESDTADWTPLDGWPGTSVTHLADLLPGGHIHRSRLATGTRIPAHLHPAAQEYMYVLSGTVDTTDGRRCSRGTFWITPAGVRHGPHTAVTDVEFLTITLGPDETVLVE